MEKTYNITAGQVDVRIVHTFKVAGKNEEELAEQANDEFIAFQESLLLEEE